MKITNIPIPKTLEQRRADLDKALQYARNKGIPDWITWIAMRSTANSKLRKKPELQRFVLDYVDEHEQEG